MAHTLMSNMTLTQLDLSACNLSNYGRDGSGLCELAEALHHNWVLQTLDVSSNGVVANSEADEALRAAQGSRRAASSNTPLGLRW